MKSDMLRSNEVKCDESTSNKSKSSKTKNDFREDDSMKRIPLKVTLQKIGCLILVIALAGFILPIRAAASFEIPGTCQVRADDGIAYTVKILDYDYDYNTYFSLRDLAVVLKGTDKAFSLDITRNSVFLNTGEVYSPVGEENTPWEDQQNPNVSLARNEFRVNGQKVYYYTLIMRLPSGYYDCFMMAADLAMILDVDITVPATGSLQIHTQDSFRISPVELEEEGYFDRFDTLLVGDATTGEIYYRYQSDVSHPIASITKLMTYLLTMDSVYEGRITLDQEVTVSDAAHLLSSSEDGVIRLEAGQQITVRELLLGALLPSSNECSLCLAETIAGSEEAFVRMMNRKVAELGLSQSVFFNSHGLPSYTESPIPPDRQNRMSAEDLFQMVSYLLKIYPQVKDITSLEYATLPSIELQVRNINPLLNNLPEVTGLKTGSTNKAGVCLVTSLTADDENFDHDLVVVVLGAENSIERNRVSELLARYGLNVFYGKAESTEAEKSEGGESEDGESAEVGESEGGESAEAGESVEDEETSRLLENLPTNAEIAVEWILQTAGHLRVEAGYPTME